MTKLNGISQNTKVKDWQPSLSLGLKQVLFLRLAT
jgi:hypothetical protein